MTDPKEPDTEALKITFDAAEVTECIQSTKAQRLQEGLSELKPSEALATFKHMLDTCAPGALLITETGLEITLEDHSILGHYLCGARMGEYYVK
ncbi:MAG: hypothetical protein JRD89_01595 [Deltaproteobacteria bacterium]|nr:hypothetical protein [Deltaproteobacteria bacterium]